jgi:hypothetical protein
VGIAVCWSACYTIVCKTRACVHGCTELATKVPPSPSLPARLSTRFPRFRLDANTVIKKHHNRGLPHADLRAKNFPTTPESRAWMSRGASCQ